MSNHYTSKNHQTLKDYYSFVLNELSCNPNDLYPNSIFQLDAYANPRLCQDILEKTIFNQQKISIPFTLYCFVRAFIKVCLEMVRLTLRSGTAKSRFEEDINKLLDTDLWLLAHIEPHQNTIRQREFQRFLQYQYPSSKVAVLGLKMPHLALQDYMQSTDWLIPIEAHVKAIYIWQSFVDYLTFYSDLRKSKLRGTVLEQHVLHDFSRLQSIYSRAIAHTASELACHAQHQKQGKTSILVPYECKDWQKYFSYRLTQKITQIELCEVQISYFSPNDLNMYQISGKAPTYCQYQPDKLFVFNETWRDIAMVLGYTGAIEISKIHRFSHSKIPVSIDSTSSKLLYISSINRNKTASDLHLLSQLENWQVDVKLHPGSQQVKLPKGCRIVESFTERYAIIFHANTSMIFEIETEQRLFVYLHNKNTLYQNPTQWYPEWSGTILEYSNNGDYLDAKTALETLLSDFTAKADLKLT